MAAAWLGVTDLKAQMQVSVAVMLSEVEMDLRAGKNTEAAVLLEQVLDRVGRGEALPPGVTLDQVRLLTATTQFQVQAFARAEEIASKLLSAKPAAQVAADARLVLGLSLALQKKYAEAVPVFQALEATPAHREKALMYRAMAAREAGQVNAAIDALNRLLVTAPRDADWADSALTLIALQLQQKNPGAASRGLDLLRGNLGIVDNLAVLNVLGLQLGDALLAANDFAGALKAYRTVFPRAELIRLQQQRTAAMETQLARRKAAARVSIMEGDALRRLETRIKTTRTALEQITQSDSYDATLFYRLGHAFLRRGGAWEAALVFERLLKDYPHSAEREPARLELVRAYAEAGRMERLKTAVDGFGATAPGSTLLPQALYLAAQAAAEHNRPELQFDFLQRGVSQFPDAEVTEFMVLMLANAHFAAGRYEEAKAVADQYAKKYPKGRFAEDAVYLRAMAWLVLGRATEAVKAIDGYLEKYPKGRFVADARYRIGAALYAMEDYAAAEKQLTRWLADFPRNHAQRGEVLSTFGDVQAGQGHLEEAITSYRSAMTSTLSDEQLGYVLDELTKHYQSRRDYDTAALMWEEFARKNPDHPFVINAAYWIGRLRAREGRSDQALEQMAVIARRYLADPDRDTVERLLTQVAALLARAPRPGADGVRPPPPTAAQISAQVGALLANAENREQPTVKARLLFTEAEVAALRKDPERHDQLLARIGAEIPPDALSAALLGQVGDVVRQQGRLDQARACYDQLLLRYPRSMYADFGYVGLGEIAYLAGDHDTALVHFTQAIDRTGARFKLLEATLGRAKALLAGDRLDAAKELFEQIAANRAWRGEATAQSIYSLGEILLKRGGTDDLAQAQAHFQRVYISYRKFTPWVARAYLRSGQTFEKLGQSVEALATYKEMLRERERFESYPELKRAEERVRVLDLQTASLATADAS